MSLFLGQQECSSQQHYLDDIAVQWLQVAIPSLPKTTGLQIAVADPYECLSPSLTWVTLYTASRMPVGLAGSGKLYGNCSELPFLAQSFDVVLLPYDFPFAGEVKETLKETFRVLKPEGVLIVLGLNRLSSLGSQVFSQRKPEGAGNNYPQERQLRFMLAELGGEIVRSCRGGYRIGYRLRRFPRLSKCLEKITRLCCLNLGAGVYGLSVRKRVIPLTSIKPRWTLTPELSMHKCLRSSFRAQSE